MLLRASLGIGILALSVSTYLRAQQTPSHVYRNDALIEVAAPAQPLVLLQEAEIPLTLHAQDLKEVTTAQSYPAREGGYPTGNILGSDRATPILHKPDGSAYIKVIPMGLGKIELAINGRFPDGGLFFKSIILDVGPSGHRPEIVRIGSFGTPAGPNPIVLMDMNRRQRNRLIINAQYEGLRYPLTIDASFAQFQVRTQDSTAGVDLNKASGALQAIHPGIVMVESTFSGRHTLTCVAVMQNGGDPFNEQVCRRLLKPGEVWPDLSR